MTPIATPSEEIPGQRIKSQIYVVDVAKDSAADKGGLKPGDIFISGKDINGSTTDFTSIDSVQKFSADNVGKEAVYTLKRQNETVDKTVQVSNDKTAPLGVAIYDQSVVKVKWYKAPIVALRETWEITKATFSFFGQFVTQLFHTGKVSDQVGGPVAIYNISGQAARAGYMAFLQLVIMLSVNLGIINILPFPALDGGRALFIILEKAFGKKVIKEEFENLVHTIGFFILIALIILVTYNDILRLIRK
jgi:regulator of sigma E protease